MAKLFKNPTTGEQKTACQWSIELQHSGPGAFRSYYKKYNDRGQPEKAFATATERKKTAYKNRRRPAKQYYNPFDDKSGTAKEWAKCQGCTIGHFRRKYRERGPNDLSTWQALGEDQNDAASRFERKGSEEWQSMEGMGRGKAINDAKSNDKATRGPVMPYLQRRGKLHKTKVGTWEEKNIPDRWGHLKGEL